MVHKIIIILGLCLLAIMAVNAALSENSTVNTTQVDQKDQKSTPIDSKVIPRGQMLYENHCRQCHDSIVHIREGKQVKSTDDIRYWVSRWSNELKLHWNSEDMQQVVEYLENTFYSF